MIGLAGHRPIVGHAFDQAVDPDTGEIVYSVFDENALGDDFDARYLAHTLEEVRS